jgi:DNA-binding beta-propeller fold protein YncE
MSGKRYSPVPRKGKRTRFLPRVEQLEIRSLLNGNPIQLAPIGVLPLVDGAEISAYDAASRRLFVTGESLHIVDLADPQNPAEIGTVPVGGTTSVAVSNGLVAAAVPADPQTDPGKVVFLDVSGTVLKEVTVGALPDMITFTPDGQKLLVANEGEPDGDVDPAGSVSIIDLSAGVANATVTAADFTAFDGRENELRNQGIRIFPDKKVSEDVEPEYIAAAADGKTAFVTLQEANAFGVLDLSTGKIKEILPLGLKDHSRGAATLEQFGLTNLPDLGTPATGQVIKLGGLSGLWYDGMTPGGNYKFLSLANRGPNADPTEAGQRPFLLPDYQARVVELELNPMTGQVAITNQIMLTRADGAKPISGLPNIPGVDEVPVDAAGNPLGYDPFGADLEGIVRAPDGTLWMCDEYRPSIYHFDTTGKLIARYVPQGTGELGGQPAGTYGTETLPAEYSQRVANRGFEGIAYDTDTNLVYGFVQSPLANPGQATSDASSTIRMLGIDPGNGAPVTEYVYLLESPAVRVSKVDKIGDAVYAGEGKFYVIERDSGTTPESKKYVFEVDLKGATNLLDSSRYDPYFLGGSGGYGGSFATDSASAATAIATGFKTDDGNLAWLPGDPPGGALETIAESLRDDLGYSIGVVSTVPFSHATPAGFVSHNVKRSNTWNIAHEILFDVQPEVVIGGGLDSYFAKAVKDQTGADQDLNDNNLNDDYDAFKNGTDGTGYVFVERAAGSTGGSKRSIPSPRVKAQFHLP